MFQTRKPCYRKGDRAMRPGQFRESVATPTATLPEIIVNL